MTYYKIKCPVCNSIVEQGTNPHKHVAIPLAECSFCNSWYKTKNMEWAVANSFEKFKMICNSYVLSISTLATIIISCATMLYWLLPIIWLPLTVLLCFIRYKLPSTKKAIAESNERAQSHEYLLLLAKLGYEISSKNYSQSFFLMEKKFHNSLQPLIRNADFCLLIQKNNSGYTIDELSAQMVGDDDPQPLFKG